MKNIVTCALLLLICCYGYAQKIDMRVVYTTGGTLPKDGETVKALEFKIAAETSFISGSGTAVGKAIPGKLFIKKDIDSSANPLFRRLVMGQHFPSIVFDYYDDKNTNYYSITITEAFVTNLEFLTPECPSCLKLENLIGFVFKTIKLEDKIKKTSITWDIAQARIL